MKLMCECGSFYFLPAYEYESTMTQPTSSGGQLIQCAKCHTAHVYNFTEHRWVRMPTITTNAFWEHYVDPGFKAKEGPA